MREVSVSCLTTNLLLLSLGTSFFKKIHKQTEFWDMDNYKKNIVTGPHNMFETLAKYIFHSSYLILAHIQEYVMDTM